MGSLIEKFNEMHIGIRIGILLLLAFIIIGVVVMLFYNDTPDGVFALTVDGVKIEKKEELVKYPNGDEQGYLPIREIADILGRNFNYGEYLVYNEDRKQCYVDDGLYVGAYAEDSNRIYKTKIGEDADWTYFEVEEEAMMINDKLYATIEAIEYGFDINIKYDPITKKMEILTLAALVKAYEPKVKEWGYTKIDDNTDNQRSILAGVIIVERAKKYGAINISDGSILVGTKYDTIEYKYSTNEFYVSVAEKVGVVAGNGLTILTPDYDKIKLFDKELGLRLVYRNGYYGIVKEDGSILLHEEFTRIGVDTSLFPELKREIENIIYDSCILVQKGAKWGIYSKRGEILLPIEYDDMGYLLRSYSSKVADNLLLVKTINGIIVSNLDGKLKKYGIVTNEGEMLVPIEFDVISAKRAGKDTIYYLKKGNEEIELIQYLDQQEEAKKTPTE